MAKVLILDVDPELVEVLPIILTQHGHQAIVLDPHININDVAFIRPDLVLLTDVANEINPDLCLKVKSDQRTETIPIVLLSVLPDIEDVAFASKADGYIKMPFDIQEIADAVNIYLL